MDGGPGAGIKGPPITARCGVQKKKAPQAGGRPAPGWSGRGRRRRRRRRRSPWPAPTPVAPDFGGLFVVVGCTLLAPHACAAKGRGDSIDMTAAFAPHPCIRDTMIYVSDGRPPYQSTTRKQYKNPATGPPPPPRVHTNNSPPLKHPKKQINVQSPPPRGPCASRCARSGRRPST